MQKPIKKGQSPTNAESSTDLLEMESEQLEDSSNEETEEETEDGQQDRKEVDSIIVEMDKKEEKKAGGQQKTSEEEERIMKELKLLSPATMAAEIERLEKELYELSQREARELTRAKHLFIFGSNRRRSIK